MEILFLKSVACLALFMLFYKLVLEQLSIHHFKRYYLILALISSVTIPFITFYNYVDVVVPENNVISTATTMPQNFEVIEIIDEPINYIPILLWSLYAIGVLFFAVKFTLHLKSLIEQIRCNEKLKTRPFVTVLLPYKTIPHTFLNYIFLNKTDYFNQNIPKEVILHEQTHAREKHSLDILFIELLQILFWFNPLLYFIRKDMRLNHEFLADAAVLKQGISTKTYQYTLLEYTTRLPKNSLANAINYPTLKKRIKIMKTQSSKTAILVRTLLLAPLLALLVFSFSKTEVVKTYRKTQKNTLDVSTFKIYIKKSNDKIYLNCTSGCDWKTLTFSNPNKKTYLSNSGIENLNDKSGLENKAYYIFLDYSDNLLNLKSVKGTAWRDLSFNLVEGNTYSFNQYGLNGIVEVPIGSEFSNEKPIKNLNKINNIKDYKEKRTTITLQIKQNPLELTLEGKPTNLENLVSDFDELKLTKPDMFIDTEEDNISYNLIRKLSGLLKNRVEFFKIDKVIIEDNIPLKTNTVKSKNNTLMVNGIACNSDSGCKLNFTKKQLLGLVLGTSSGDKISEFKFKVPGFPTVSVKDNQLNSKAKDFLNRAEINKENIVVFNVKSGDRTYPYVYITLLNESNEIEKTLKEEKSSWAIESYKVEEVKIKETSEVKGFVNKENKTNPLSTSYKIKSIPDNLIDVKLTVNGIECDSDCQFSFTIKQIEQLILGTTNGNISRFKIKFQGKPTLTIEDSKLNSEAKAYLENSKESDRIMIYDIKSTNKSDKFSPVLITLNKDTDEAISKSPKVLKGENSSIPMPVSQETAAKLSGFENFLNDKDFKDAKIYYHGKVISKEEAIKLFKENGSIDMITGKDKNGNYKIELSDTKKK